MALGGQESSGIPVSEAKGVAERRPY
jgi:hypothetical protein